MQKYSQSKTKVIEKIPSKNKILVKSVISEKSEILVTRFGYEDTMAACGYSDGYLRIFNLSTENKINEISLNSKPKQNIPINCLRWRPQNQNVSMSSVILVATSNGHLYQYAAKTGKQLFHAVEQENQILAMDYNPDGKNFATAGKDNTIRIYDEQSKKITQELKGITWHKTGHNNRLFSLKYKSDQSDILISGGWDQNVHVWDRRTGDVISTINGPKIAGDSIDIKDNLILTGANKGDDQLQIWDWRQNKLVKTLQWDEEEQYSHTFLYCAQFCKNAPNTVMACGGNQLKLFSLDNYSEILQVKFQQAQSLYSCDSSYGSNRLLVGGKSGSLTFLGSNKTFE